MAVNLMKDRDTQTYLYKEYVIDTASDVSNLPVQPECATGSLALCIANSEVYILNSSGSWGVL